MNPTATLLEPEVLELIRSRNFVELREIMHSLQKADVADILSGIPDDEAAVAFRVLPQDDAGEVFAYFAPDVQERIIHRLTDAGEGGAVGLVEAMDPDDRVKLLDELPPAVSQRLLAGLSPEERKRTQVILGYPPKSVGRLMTPDYVRVRPEWTVAKALDHVRRYGRDAETVNVVYVIDQGGVLIDDLRLRQLIMAEPDHTIESLMNRQFVALRGEQPRAEAVEALQKYDRVALPVVDSRGTLLGIVTHDDCADVAQAEVTEDMQKIGGMRALEEPYMATSVLGLFAKRIPWLALLFMSELLTSNAIAFFEDEIKRAAILAAFIPAIISSGGNSGSQASTLVIRALGLKEIGLGDWWRVLRRELACGLLLGGVIAVIGIFRIHLFGWMGWFPDADVQDHYSILGVTIGITLLCVVLWGSIMGAMLPFVLKRLGLDPATSSAPFVATLVDVTGIVLYFSAALAILSSTLLSTANAVNGLRPLTDVAVVSSAAKGSGSGAVFELRVRADGAAAESEPARVVVPAALLPGGAPAAGARLRLTFPTVAPDGVEIMPATGRP